MIDWIKYLFGVLFTGSSGQARKDFDTISQAARADSESNRAIMMDIIERQGKTIDRQGEEIQDIKTELKTVQQLEQQCQIDRINDKQEFSRKLLELERQILSIRSDRASQIINMAAENRPLPYWIKSPDGTMQYINPAYTKYFKKTPEEYIGRKDTEVWGEKIGKVYQNGDREAAENGLWTGSEPIVINEQDQTHKWLIVKYGIYHNGVHVATAGEASLYQSE